MGQPLLQLQQRLQPQQLQPQQQRLLLCHHVQTTWMRKALILSTGRAPRVLILVVSETIPSPSKSTFWTETKPTGMQRIATTSVSPFSPEQNADNRSSGIWTTATSRSVSSNRTRPPFTKISTAI